MGTFPTRSRPLLILARTYLISALGVGAFYLLALPLPFLLGPITACLIAALAGLDLRGQPLVNDAMRAILGVAVGATLTLPVVLSMGAMWPTLAMIPGQGCCKHGGGSFRQRRQKSRSNG